MFKNLKKSILLLLILTATCILLLRAPISVFAEGKFIPADERVDMVYDDNRGILYITAGDSVLRYQLSSNSFISPFQLGGSLKGIDLSLDGNTLAVADSTGGWIYLLDLSTEQVKKVEFDVFPENIGTYAVAFTKYNTVFVTYTSYGSGQRIPLIEYSIEQPGDEFDEDESEEFVDYWEITDIYKNSMVSASADGLAIGFAEGDSTSGIFGRYNIDDEDLLTSGYGDWGTGQLNYEVAVNRNGSQYAIPTWRGTYITQNSLAYNVIYEYFGGARGEHPIGVAYHPVKDYLFLAQAETTKIDIFDSTWPLKIASFNFENYFADPNGQAFKEGRLKVSRKGDFLFSTVDNGIRYVDLNTPINSTTYSPSHLYNPSSDNTIDVVMPDTFSINGVDGYSFSWSQNPNEEPDIIRDAEANTHIITSTQLPDGDWYFHLKTKDNAGNWSSTMHLGPFTIITPPAPTPSVAAPSASNSPPQSPQKTTLNTKLTLSVKPKTIKAGRPLIIKGELKDSNGQPVANKEAVIKALVKQKKKVRGKFKWFWKRMVAIKTNKNGKFSFKYKPKKTTRYQAIFSGNDEFKICKSNIVKVVVKQGQKI